MPIKEKNKYVNDLISSNCHYVVDLLEAMKVDLNLYSYTDITLDEFKNWLENRKFAVKA